MKSVVSWDTSLQKALLLLFSVFLLLALGANSAAQTLAAWPSLWIGYTQTGGALISDPTDQNGGQTDKDITTSTYNAASVSIAVSDSNIFFRLQMLIDVEDLTKGGFMGSVWLVMLHDSSYAHRVTVGLNGKSNTNDVVYTTDSTGSVDRTVYYHNTNNSNAMRTVQVATGSTEYYLDFQVPISYIRSFWTDFTMSSTFIPAYGTSTNINNITMDYASCDALLGSCSMSGALLAGITPTSFGDLQIGVLPVELVSFTAAPYAGGVSLKWVTATEVDNYGFDVQSSPDGQNWRTLTFIP